MYWDEPEEPAAAPESAAVADLRYRIRCAALPVDHARALYAALRGALPWLETEPRAGVHTLHGAESGNGWLRPEDPDQLLPLSRRTRLALRLPRARLPDAAALCGRTLRVGGVPLEVGEARPRPLRAWRTVFARYVTFPDADGGEDAFLARCAEELRALGVAAPRLLPGRGHAVAGPDGPLRCRSLLLDGLEPAPSLRLQERGLGTARRLGCGLFLPHKSLAAVAAAPPDAGGAAARG